MAYYPEGRRKVIVMRLRLLFFFFVVMLSLFFVAGNPTPAHAACIVFSVTNASSTTTTRFDIPAGHSYTVVFTNPSGGPITFPGPTILLVTYFAGGGVTVTDNECSP